ncbi:MAG TPA: hypothetical protein VFT07_07315 [Sphingomicrobium sp.]|nr:hypothetical protein [Sphingomicrobium sp.]
MTVEFIKQLHQNALEKAWNARPAKPPVDPMLKHRKKVLSRIDAALAQLESGENNPPRGLYQTRDNFNGMRVQLKYGQRALTIDGRDHWFVEDAATFFRSAREAVGSGELDRAILDAVDRTDKVPVKEAKEKDKEKAALPVPRNEPPALQIVTGHEAAVDDKASADEPRAANPGRFARKYEKLLAAGILSEPAL